MNEKLNNALFAVLNVAAFVAVGALLSVAVAVPAGTDVVATAQQLAAARHACRQQPSVVGQKNCIVAMLQPMKLAAGR